MTHKTALKAMAACRALCQAYRNGELNDSCMRWEDVDYAWGLAVEARVALRRERGRKKVESSGTKLLENSQKG